MTASDPRAARAHKSKDVEIASRSALAALLDRVVAERFGGVARRAAAHAGIDPGTLSRLRGRGMGSITIETFEALQRMMPDGPSLQSLDEALLKPEDRAALVDYRRWLARAHEAVETAPDPDRNDPFFLWTAEGLSRIDEPILTWTDAVEHAPEKLADGRYDDPERLERMKGIRAAFGLSPHDNHPADPQYVPRWESFKAYDGSRLLLRLSTLPAVVESVRAFAAEMVDRGHLDPADADAFWLVYEKQFPTLDSQPWSQINHLRGWRVFLAWRRTLDPLLAARESACVERMWEELTDKELADFVRAGLRRESILLDRAPDAKRARAMRRTSPSELPLRHPLWDAENVRVESVERDRAL